MEAIINFRPNKTYSNNWLQREPLWRVVAVPQNFFFLQWSALLAVKVAGKMPLRIPHYKLLFKSYFLVKYGKKWETEHISRLFEELPMAIQLSWKLAAHCSRIWSKMVFPEVGEATRAKKGSSSRQDDQSSDDRKSIIPNWVSDSPF